MIGNRHARASRWLIVGPARLDRPSFRPSVSPSFRVSFPAARSAAPLDGRVLLLLSTDSTAEPRFQVNDGPATQIVFGVDVEGLAPGKDAVVDASAWGYPLRSLSSLPAGRYRVQALLNRYETFKRSDGHTVKLPPDRGEGQQWASKPGNLYSVPQWITITPGKDAVVRVVMDQEIPAIKPPEDTKYVKHVTITSERLSKFWGRPVTIGAHVLLPEGFDSHPDARYPLVVNHGHFPSDLGGFRAEPRGSESAVRLQRAVPPQVLQPDPAGACARLLPDLDRPELSAGAADRDPASDAVLRRLVRGQLREQRSVRRRDHVRADPRDREALPRDREGVRALHLRRFDRRVGSDGGAGVLPRGVQWCVGGVSRPDRLPGLHGGQSLRRHQRLLRGQPVEAHAAARAPQLAGSRERHARRGESPRARDRDEGTVGRPVGRLAVGVFARWARTGIPSRSGTRSPA